MLARLFLARLVPEEYQQLLYIDGDTQISGSLDALIDAAVPAGHFMAATDPMTFKLAKAGYPSQRIAEYFSTVWIPLGNTYKYFNSTGTSGMRSARRHGRCSGKKIDLTLPRSGRAEHHRRRPPDPHVPGLEFPHFPAQFPGRGQNSSDHLPFHGQPRALAWRVPALLGWTAQRHRMCQYRVEQRTQ